MVTGFSATSVSLSWQPPTLPNGDIIQYTVEFTAGAVSGSRATPRTASNVDGLTPFTLYVFSVRAVTTTGPGSMSETVEQRTAEGGMS